MSDKSERLVYPFLERDCNSKVATPHTNIFFMQSENQKPKALNLKAFEEFTTNLFKVHTIDDVLKDQAKAFVEVMGSPNFEDPTERQSFMESFFRMNLVLQAIKDKGTPKKETVLKFYYDMI